MKRFIMLLLTLFAMNVLTGFALAVPAKIKIAEFTVTGAANKDELKDALQSLLASRLSGDEILVVDGGVDAAAQVSGSYFAFGQTFSIDAMVKDSKGAVLGRRFVQGAGQDDLIPAIGRLADQLRPLLAVPAKPVAKESPAVALAPVVPAAAPVAVPLPVAAAQPVANVKGLPAAPPEAAVQAVAVVKTKTDVVAVPAGDIIRTEPVGAPVVQQERMEGALLGIAPGRVLASGEREFVVAGQKAVQLYRQGTGLKKVAEYEIKGEGKILALDAADVDQNGQPEIYVTVMEQETLVSRALGLNDKGFFIIAERLPYYFRAIAIDGGAVRLYAQQISSGDADFYGDVREVLKKEDSYTLGSAIKLPKYANLYTFNRFIATDGTARLVVYDLDGNLRVLDDAAQELWKGSDRFGGSEVYFKRDEQHLQPISNDRYRWRFLEPRLTVTKEGEVIAPRNSGMFVLGNARNYSKNILYGLAWNGAGLTERWHSKESPNYLADYYYDAARKELVILEQVQKEGMFSKGASAIAIKKIE